MSNVSILKLTGSEYLGCLLGRGVVLTELGSLWEVVPVE